MSYERFARQYRFEPPSGFPLTLPCTSIVHHLSGPSIYAHARHRARVPQRAARGAPKRVLPILELSPHSGFNHPSTCAHVRLLGPCFKTGRIASGWCTILARQPLTRRGRAHRVSSVQSAASESPSLPEQVRGPLSAAQTDGADQATAELRPGKQPVRFACFQRFHVLFHFLFKVLFIFPSRYLFAIGLPQIFSLGRILPPD